MEKKEQKIKSEYTGLVPAVDQASRILLRLAKGPSLKANLTDICKSVGIHKSKGYTILNTLRKYGLVQKTAAGKTYSLGLGLLSLSRRILDNLNYSEGAGPILEMLARKTHSAALFGVINGRDVFVVAKHEADQPISVTIRLGYRFNITHGAHGKVIVAFLPKKERERILKQHNLFFHGDVSKLDRNRLRTELERCRETGFAFDEGELHAGLNVIASPVFNSQESLIGSMFIMGTFQDSCVQEFGPLVAGSARQFSSVLGADVKRIFRLSAKENEKDG